MLLVVGMAMQQNIYDLCSIVPVEVGMIAFQVISRIAMTPSFVLGLNMYFPNRRRSTLQWMFSICLVMQGDKIRRRENWSKWIPSVGQTSPYIGLQTQNQSSDVMLATSIQEVQLDDVISTKVSSTDNTVEHSDAEPRRLTSSDEAITQSELSKGLRLAETSDEGCT